MNHFSKYGLQDDNEEEDFVQAQQVQQQQREANTFNIDQSQQQQRSIKTSDPSLIKSSERKSQQIQSPLPINKSTTTPIGAESNTPHPAFTTAMQSLSATVASGAGGLGGACGGPPTIGLHSSATTTAQLQVVCCSCQ